MNEIDIYINDFSADVQEKLTILRKIIKELAPQATERICMGMPTYDLNGRWLVHFAGCKKHIGFYPQPSGIIAFKDELAMYKTTKGAIQFPLTEPLPIDIIRKIIQFRVEEQISGRVKKGGRKNKL